MTDKADKFNDMDLPIQELQGTAGDSLRGKDLFYLCLAKWRWFTLSTVMTVGIALLYILCTPPVYTRSAFIMVKEDTNGNAIGSDVASMFADLGLVQVNANVNNELLAMQMPAVILEVVTRLDLDVDYKVNGFLHKKTLYGENLPIKATLPELDDAESASFSLRLLPDGKAELSDFESSERDLADEIVTGTPNDTLHTPLGKVVLTPTPYYSTEKEYPQIHVSRTNLYDCVDICKENLKAELSSEDATIIELSYKDVSIARSEDVLNTIIAVYNEEWMKDKNQITVSTSQFISDRLGALERELSDVDTDISTYKSENLLPDVDKASTLLMEQAQENNNKLVALSTQIAVAGYIRDFLTAPDKRDQLLPVNPGLESSDIEARIAEYNALQLKRNNLMSNSSDRNPLITDIDKSLSAMRGAIVSSIDNLVRSLDTQRNDILKDERKTRDGIAAGPEQDRYLRAVGRQQTVKEALYLFMLQKREENELSQAFTPYNTRILTPPSGNLEPVAPKKKKIIAVALILGLILPAAFICLRENMNSTVRGRKDLERTIVPFIGEIPFYTGRKKKSPFGRRENENRQIVVKEGSRNILNEAFRVLRTNLEFMSGDKHEAILLTSFNPGSGKTFLTINIAAGLAIKGKHILVIDGDLRRCTLSSYIGSPNIGLSDYLAKRTDKLDDIIRHVSEHYAGLDMIPVGTIPPNPTELLSGERMNQLINRMRSEYDYVFIDCPPVDIVADTQILERLADRTLFIVRAGLLERSMLTELDKAYREQKFKNMSVVLNGTDAGKHRYAYRYGYYYCYSYGNGQK